MGQTYCLQTSVLKTKNKNYGFFAPLPFHPWPFRHRWLALLTLLYKILFNPQNGHIGKQIKIAHIMP